MLRAWNELETTVIMESINTLTINTITNGRLYNEIGINVSFGNELLGFPRY